MHDGLQTRNNRKSNDDRLARIAHALRAERPDNTIIQRNMQTKLAFAHERLHTVFKNFWVYGIFSLCDGAYCTRSLLAFDNINICLEKETLRSHAVPQNSFANFSPSFEDC